ncbi:serine/arginine repetitive matrix protein 1-like [Lutra lutra]|uniref:serine/arginine repetitive matrix protein 1-like n=1 Tax=Lutra lutra TaxID=9657 RepID=UPI001FD5F05D|nr:serine/arginine repetitive matrix protein 1-like [Lutra lutra]
MQSRAELYGGGSGQEQALSQETSAAARDPTNRKKRGYGKSTHCASFWDRQTVTEVEEPVVMADGQDFKPGTATVCVQARPPPDTTGSRPSPRTGSARTGWEAPDGASSRTARPEGSLRSLFARSKRTLGHRHRAFTKTPSVVPLTTRPRPARPDADPPAPTSTGGLPAASPSGRTPAQTVRGASVSRPGLHFCLRPRCDTSDRPVRRSTQGRSPARGARRAGPTGQRGCRQGRRQPVAGTGESEALGPLPSVESVGREAQLHGARGAVGLHRRVSAGSPAPYGGRQHRTAWAAPGLRRWLPRRRLLSHGEMAPGRKPRHFRLRRLPRSHVKRAPGRKSRHFRLRRRSFRPLYLAAVVAPVESQAPPIPRRPPDFFFSLRKVSFPKKTLEFTPDGQKFQSLTIQENWLNCGSSTTLWALPGPAAEASGPGAGWSLGRARAREGGGGPAPAARSGRGVSPPRKPADSRAGGSLPRLRSGTRVPFRRAARPGCGGGAGGGARNPDSPRVRARACALPSAVSPCATVDRPLKTRASRRLARAGRLRGHARSPGPRKGFGEFPGEFRRFLGERSFRTEDLAGSVRDAARTLPRGELPARWRAGLTRGLRVLVRVPRGQPAPQRTGGGERRVRGMPWPAGDKRRSPREDRLGTARSVLERAGRLTSGSRSRSPAARCRGSRRRRVCANQDLSGPRPSPYR